MPRAKEPSVAARWLVQELATRGLSVSYRSIEDWAARGLAPAPVRRSQGRGRGMSSEYPPGSVDQYAAVASVMRRGRPWQVSVVKLLVRGYLPTRGESLVRQALRDLLVPSEVPSGDDTLDRAEKIAAELAETPFGRSFLRAYERNLRRSKRILEPDTQIRAVAVGVMTTLILPGFGEPELSHDALVEMAAAHGVPVADMSDEDRAVLVRFAEAFLTQVATIADLVRIVSELSLSRLRELLPQARVEMQNVLAGLSEDLPRPNEDIANVLTVLMALMLIRIEEFGGDEAIAKLADQARNQSSTPSVAARQ